MRRAAQPLLWLLLASAAASQVTQTPSEDDLTQLSNDTIIVDNENGTLVFRDVNGTAIEIDGNPEEIVRKKRTFGDIVFRGLADVLGYNVQRKPPQVAFPPPLPPVPGIDTPLAVSAPAVAPAPAPAAAPTPCGQARAAGPPPCKAQQLPAPQPKALPCPKPRAARAKKPKPTPPPPPPPPPPCPQPRANPATPAPCAPPPPPPKQQADNLERITSNLRLNFNFARGPAVTAAQAPAAEAAEVAADDEADAQLDNQEQFVPIPIIPQAAKLPEDKPRVYVDAFVVQNGVPRRVDAVDAKHLKNGQQANIDEDYLAYDDENAQQQVDDDDDYEDVQESRDRQSAVRQFGNAVDQFWQQRGKRRKLADQKAQKLPENHYQNVHFGDRRLADDYQGESHQSLQRERPRPNRIPEQEPEDDAEATTTTEDPRRPLKPRVLPPTEHNPNQIDTVTVRVPPIYREKRPRKLHRERPEHPDRDEESESNADYSSREHDTHGYGHDADSDDSSLAPRTERPRRKRRRKQSRKTRSAELTETVEEDYYGNKVPISKEEQFYMRLTVPPPTLDADVARHLKPVSSGYFLEDHERLRDDPSQRIRDDPSHRIRDDPSHRIRDDPSHRIRDDPSHRIRDNPKHKIRDDDKSKERSEESERVDEDERSGESERLVAEDEERSTEDKDRTDEDQRSGELERTDNLSPNARVLETVQQNNYVRATNVQVDDPHPPVVSVKRKTVHIGQE